MFFQFTNHVRNRRRFLTNRHINTNNACAFLVHNRVQSHSSFTCLTVTNNQFTLTTTNRNHRVNSFQTCLHRLVNRLTRNHARCNFFNRCGFSCIDWTFAINRLTQRIDYATYQFTTNWHFQNATSTFHFVAFFDVLVFTQHNRTNRIALQVHRQAKCITRKF